MASLFANSGLFTHPRDAELHHHSFGVCVCPPDEYV